MDRVYSYKDFESKHERCTRTHTHTRARAHTHTHTHTAWQGPHTHSLAGAKHTHTNTFTRTQAGCEGGVSTSFELPQGSDNMPGAVCTLGGDGERGWRLVGTHPRTTLA
jgi:hypothetical protein